MKKKFKHTTCKENWNKEADIKKNSSSPFVIYVLILVFIYLLALVLFFRKIFFDFSAFSYWVGLGLWMLFYAVRLYQLRTPKAARTLMLVSVSYISLLQIVFIVDKFLR